MDQNDNLTNVGHFMGYFKWDIPPPHCSGIAWIELLAVFEALGYRLEQPVRMSADSQEALPCMTCKANVDLL